MCNHIHLNPFEMTSNSDEKSVSKEKSADATNFLESLKQTANKTKLTLEQKKEIKLKQLEQVEEFYFQYLDGLVSNAKHGLYFRAKTKGTVTTRIDLLVDMHHRLNPKFSYKFHHLHYGFIPNGKWEKRSNSWKSDVSPFTRYCERQRSMGYYLRDESDSNISYRPFIVLYLLPPSPVNNTLWHHKINPPYPPKEESNIDIPLIEL